MGSLAVVRCRPPTRPDALPPGRRRARGGPFARAFALSVACAVTACAGGSTGHYHTVSAGENLYRIGLRYGVDARTLAQVNGIDDVTSLRVGQRVWVPRSSAGGARSRDASAAQAARTAARTEAARAGELAFVWPVEAVTVSSGFGRRGRRPHEGIDLRAPKGTPIRAAESGKVIHADWLGDYGKVVIIKHAGYYRTVYAHANKLYVRRGQFVERGQHIADIGTTGNATGPHLHFEVRLREKPRDPMLYLP